MKACIKDYLLVYLIIELDPPTQVTHLSWKWTFAKQHLPAQKLSTVFRSTQNCRQATLYHVHLSVHYHLLCNQ